MHQLFYARKLQKIQKKIIKSLEKYNSIIQIDINDYIKTNDKII